MTKITKNPSFKDRMVNRVVCECGWQGQIGELVVRWLVPDDPDDEVVEYVLECPNCRIDMGYYQVYV